MQPSIPQIFMGEESAHSTPFPFFTNFEDEAPRFVTPWNDYQKYENIIHIANRSKKVKKNRGQLEIF